jgi:hypothetical protein
VNVVRGEFPAGGITIHNIEHDVRRLALSGLKEVDTTRDAICDIELGNGTLDQFEGWAWRGG